MSQTDFDIVVAGGGIAGLSAALAAARLGRSTLALTGDVLGGHLLSIEKIEGYPGFPDGVAGYDLCPMTQEAAVAAGARIAAGEVLGLESENGAWRITTNDGAYRARAVILATGTALKALGVAGETRLAGKGVSQCASCDAPLMRGRVAAVVGGGDSAMQEALTLAASAARVVMLVRGAALSGQASFAARVTTHPKIEIRCNSVVEEILGESVVSGVRIRETATGALADLEFAGVFVYIGLEASIAYLAGRVSLDPAARIVTDGALRTDLAGVFAAGTVRAGAACRAASAAGEGASAAIAADRYLARGVWRD